MKHVIVHVKSARVGVAVARQEVTAFFIREWYAIVPFPFLFFPGLPYIFD
jgi:hypothetical protein